MSYADNTYGSAHVTLTGFAIDKLHEKATKYGFAYSNNPADTKIHFAIVGTAAAA